MKNENILITGKLFFWLSFILGNICLFGYLITKDDQFAAGGYLLIILGTIINLLIILGLISYGLINKAQLKICIKASLIICINIPIAILYFYLGIFLMGF
jgi:LIVCS family branched-chain amino acid:cation transporter